MYLNSSLIHQSEVVKEKSTFRFVVFWKKKKCNGINNGSCKDYFEPILGCMKLFFNPFWMSWYMTYKYRISGNDVAIFRASDVLEHGNSLQDFNTKSVQGPGNTFERNPKWARNLPLGMFHGIFIEPFPQQNIKYRNWHLTLCCGFEVQKHTQSLKSVKEWYIFICICKFHISMLNFNIVPFVIRKHWHHAW